MTILIWIKNIAILLVSLFFLISGINTLLGAFKLNNPLEFLMYFFSASLLILVCIVGIIYFVFRFSPTNNKMELMKMKQNNIYNKLFFIPAIILCLAASAFGFDLEKKVVKAKLKNGLTVLMLERHLSPTVSLYIRHRIGAADEEKRQKRRPYLLEHMMFKGTTTIGAKNYTLEKTILDAIEKTGTTLDKEKLKGQKADPKIIQELSEKLKNYRTNKKIFHSQRN